MPAITPAIRDAADQVELDLEALGMSTRALLTLIRHDQGGGGGGTGAGPDSTDYYFTVTVQASQVSSTLTDFPVWVNLGGAPSDFWANVQANGGDIRVTESDGTTRCAVDLVSIDTVLETGELHFLAGSISSSTDTVFRVYYGSATAGTLSQPAVADANGRNAVWADYAAVYHGDDTTDSTGNGNTLFASGTASAGASTAKLGTALLLAGGHYEAADSASLDITSDLTLSAWLRFTTVTTTVNFLSKWDRGTASRSYLMQRDGSSTVLRAWISQTGSGSYSYGDRNWSASNNAWYFLAMSIDASAAPATGWVGAVNTVLAPSTGLSAASSVYSGAAKLGLGASFNSGTAENKLAGYLDEVRIRVGAVNADWLTAEYTNQNTPTTFYAVGTQQDA